MEPIIFHIDVNSAYLSWSALSLLEKGENTDLRKIPAIIGGDMEKRHGVVLAKSIPAKKYGVTTGEPIVNALRKCPTLTIQPPDHHLYHARSEELMQLLRDVCPDIEQVSVDECYLDFTDIADRFPSPLDAAFLMKNGIRERFGFTVNIGISENKLLAKMASDFEKPDKVHTLFLREVPVKMWPLPLGELFMGGALQRGGTEKTGDQYHRRPGERGLEPDRTAPEKPRENAVGVCQRHRPFACPVGAGGSQGNRKFYYIGGGCRHL